MVRYVRPEERLAREFRVQRAGIRDVQRPTGTEKARTMEVAEQAAQGVVTAQLTADGKNKTFRSTTVPSGTSVVGDRWEQYDQSSSPWKLLAAWSYEMTGWEPVELDSTYLPLVDIGSGTFGQLAGARLEADAIDGMTITGATVQGGVVRQEGAYNQSNLVRLTLPRNTGSWATSADTPNGVSRSKFYSMDNEDPYYELVNQPPPQVESTVFEISLRVVESSLYVNRSRVRIPDEFPVGGEVTASVWVCSVGQAKTVNVTWPDGSDDDYALLADQWTLLSETTVRSTDFIELRNAIGFYPQVMNPVAVADVTFESTTGAVGRSELVTSTDGPALVFSSGADVGSLQQIGLVSPTSLQIADVVLDSNGVAVADGNAVASDGALVLSGQSIEIIGPNSIHLAGPVTFGGDTEWANVSLATGFVVQSGVTWEWRIKGGWIQMRGRIGRSNNAVIGGSFVYASNPDAAIAAAVNAAGLVGINKITPGNGANNSGLLRIESDGAVRIASLETAFHPNVEFLL